MSEPIYILDEEKEESLSLRENVFKYLYKWPWFIGSILLCLILGILYIRYAPVIYSSEAKIKIIDDSKEFDIAEDALSLLGAGSKINLDNEIAVLKSYRLMNQVVAELSLDVQYFEVGNVKSLQIFKAPIKVTKLFPEDSIWKPITYKVNLKDGRVLITNPNDQSVLMDSTTVSFTRTKFPVRFELNPDFDFANEKGDDFLVVLNNRKETVLSLLELISVRPLTEKSDVLSIKLESESHELAEATLNELVNKFNTDGIRDRQLVSKRTLDFIDDRFLYLSKELDSIEIGKQSYKQSNNLSYIEADAGITIEKKSLAESEVFRIETQIELSKLLKNTLNSQKDYSLLPADIGVENTNINNLVYEYNQVVLQRERLATSAGRNNPAVRLLSQQISSARNNILASVNTYQNQLRISLRQLKQKENRTDAMFAKLPEKEKALRAIERQQLIKENLFLLLLQKREEAAINFAVTAPSVKVVDYGLTNLTPISPRKTVILGASLFMGLLLPLGFFFTKFSFDTKVKTKSDLEKLSGSIPVLAEIPALDDPYSFFDSKERSAREEAFRILGTNVKYMLPKRKTQEGLVLYVTSAIKGEGKTLIALNLALAFASLKKKVLLIGADLRNPQLHNYITTVDRDSTGLSSYLYDPDTKWEDCIHTDKTNNPNCHVCFSGPIPPNPSELISSESLVQFIEIAKSKYDYVIFDTAPTIQVADTLLMAEHADSTIFITRAGYTDKALIQFSRNLSKDKKLKNMAYVLNDVKFNKRMGYNYGYEYGYSADS